MTHQRVSKDGHYALACHQISAIHPDLQCNWTAFSCELPHAALEWKNTLLHVA